MLTAIIVLAIVGVIAGFIARALLPGADPMSFLETMGLGVIGSFVGGFLGYVIFGSDFNDGALQASGIIGSVLGAMLALVLYRVVVQDRAAIG